MIIKMHGHSFDFATWRGGHITELGISCRFDDIVRHQDILRQYAIGWCPGEEVICRPKKECIGVMFLKDDQLFWFHLSCREFDIVFKGLL